MKKIFLLIIFFASLVFTYASGNKEKQIDIYYSASLNGNLDGCECKSNPRSGLVKRAVFLRDLDKNSSVILETGDIFDVYPDKFLSSYILESYRDLGYDAIAVGDQEFSNGTTYLQNNLSRYPLLSNNLSILQSGGISEKISSYPLAIQKSGLRITILSVIEPEVFRFYPEDVKESIDIEDPSFVLPQLLKQNDTVKVDLRILLFHGNLKKARILAINNPSLNIIIAGHEQQIVDSEMIGNTIMVSPGAEGNNLGHLKVVSDGKNLIFYNNFIKFDYMTDPDDSLIRSRINEYTGIMTEKLK